VVRASYRNKEDRRGTVDRNGGKALDDERVDATERVRLVRYCARFTGDVHAAEDLAQQVLLDAWRHERELRNPQARQSWLFGIARNTCLMWARRRRREMSRFVEPADTNTDKPGADGLPADDFDVELELERVELVRLLERAMALLPPETRRVLVQRYVEESPQAEVAERLGLTEGAVEARLHRGKLALRRVLTTELGEDAASFGLIAPDDVGWQETRIWCPLCGRHRLNGRLRRSSGEFALRCPSCCSERGVFLRHAAASERMVGARGFQAALSDLAEWGHNFYGRGVAGRSVKCPSCGRRAPLRLSLPEDVPPSLRGMRGMHYRCGSCGDSGYQRLSSRALELPEGRRFWRQYPRIHMLPEREVEVAGRAALVMGFRAVREQAALDVVLDRDTYEVLEVHGTPRG
jgi:RNA polymerase sigma factor (sigma-70 family)